LASSVSNRLDRRDAPWYQSERGQHLDGERIGPFRRTAFDEIRIDALSHYHRTRILEKMGMTKNVELPFYVVRNNLI
jgi:hypothetical protein